MLVRFVGGMNNLQVELVIKTKSIMLNIGLGKLSN